MAAPPLTHRWPLIALLTLPLFLGCVLQTPEAQIRMLVHRAQTAAERRDAAAIHALMCEQFTDQSGMNGDDTLHSMTRYLLLHRPVYALTRLVRLDVRHAGEASAELYAALAGQPLDSLADLERVEADVLHMKLDLTDDGDGDLCVRQATWGPAPARDMLLGGAL